jgi:peptidoglycan/LPS O-acetylase OafA/YrhL
VETESAHPPGFHLPSLDGIRAICIALVVGFHAPRSEGFPPEWVPLWGYFFSSFGVLVFFVLSGFLITLLLINEERANGRIALKSFYARRIVRIVPVYLMFVAALVLIDTFTKVDIGACGYLTTLTYTKNYGCGQWVDGHLWSLAVEEQFYLFWPSIMAFAAARWRCRAGIAMIATAPIFRVLFYVTGRSGLRSFSFATNMDALMFGCAAGVLVGEHGLQMSRVLAWRPRLARSLAAAVFYALWIVQNRLSLAPITVPFATTLQAASAAYLIASYATIPGGPVYALLNTPVARYLGALSYSLYIWQQPFFVDRGYYAALQPFFLKFPYNVGACVLAAMLSYHLLEMPLLRLRKRLRPGARISELSAVDAGVHAREREVALRSEP